MSHAPPGRGIAKGQELIARRRAPARGSSRMCWMSSSSSMSQRSPSDYCIWSSIVENAALSRSAFLISSALT